MNTTSVVLITDDNYVVPTAVTIKSILVNAENPVEIYVLGVGISNKNANCMKRAGATVIRTDVKLPQFDGRHPHVSAAALLKFDLPNIFADKDKILYLDTDMIILGDLGKLFNINLGSHYAAVVKDMAGTQAGHATKLGHKDYFNSGMMLLNLAKMRDDGIPKKLVDYKLNKDVGHFMDQDCLNAVFDENVIYVSPIYNWMAPNQLNYAVQEVKDFYGIDFEPTLNNAVVVHLTNRQKVWNYVNVWGHDLWMRYYKKSIFKNRSIKFFDVDSRPMIGWVKKDNADRFFLLGIPVIRIKKRPDKTTIDLFNIRIWNIKKKDLK